MNVFKIIIDGVPVTLIKKGNRFFPLKDYGYHSYSDTEIEYFEKIQNITKTICQKQEDH